jgi:hypothetical protein
VSCAKYILSNLRKNQINIIINKVTEILQVILLIAL